MSGRVRTLDDLAGEGVGTGFLFDLPREQANRLLAESLHIDVPPGSVAYREGDAAVCLVVVQGLLRAFMSSRDGRQVTFRYGSAGDVMGLASVIGEPPPLTIQAMTATSVIALRVESVQAAMRSDAAVARVCAEELTRQLRRALDRVAQSAFDTVRQRLARQLLDLADEWEGSTPIVPVTHQDLADAIASSRVVVTRTLHEMRDEGLVETGGDRGVVLLDVAGLALAMGGADADRSA